jgi:hypothetical protein
MSVCANQTLNYNYMPLLKNGVKYILTKEDKDKIRNTVGKKFPVKFKMLPEFFRPDPVNKGRISRPPGVNIKTTSVIADADEGYTKWEWGRSFKVTGRDNIQKSSDPMISFETEYSIGENQMDLLYFILFCCPNLKGSPHATANTKITFMLEDVEKESLDIINKEADMATATHYIVREWSNSRVRKVAAAMNIPLATDPALMGEAEVRRRLLNVVKNDKQMKLFNELVKTEDETTIRAGIRIMEDKNILDYSDAWYLIDNSKERPEKIRKICEALPGRSPLESLIAHFKKNPTDFNTISENLEIPDNEVKSAKKPTK